MSLTPWPLGPSRSKESHLPTIIRSFLDTEERLISNDSLVSTSAVGPITSPKTDKSIVYTVHPNGQYHRSNMCRHSRVSRIYSGGTDRVRMDWSSHGTYFITAFHHSLSESFHLQALSIAKTALGVTLRDGVLGQDGLGMINNAAESLRPDLTTISLPNFLLEIDDITRTWQAMKKTVNFGKTLRGVGVKDAAELNLEFNFGLKPLIGDLISIEENLRSLNAKIEQFEAALGLTLHGSRVVLSDSPSLSGIYYPSTANGETFGTAWTITCKRKVTAHIAWRPQPLQVVGALHKTILGLLDKFGIELNPRIIWDALPFTFVLDWFFDVGSFLGRYRIDAMELPIEYVDSYLQYSEELVFESSTAFDSTNRGMTPVLQSGRWVTSEKFFQRLPLRPDYASFAGLGAKFPTARQVVLGLSLITVLGSPHRKVSLPGQNL